MKVKVKLSDGSLIEQVTPKNSFIIGRSPKCDIPIQDDSLSRNHCQVDFENDTFYITDLSSSNGVFIDGKRIPAEKKSVFTTFQEVHVGLLEVSFIDSDDIGPRKASAQSLKERTNPGDIREENTSQKKPSITKTNNKNNNFKIVSLLSFLIFAGVIYYQFYYSEVLTESSAENQSPNIQTPVVKSLEFYQIADASKNCSNTNLTICETFKLSADNQEGALLQNNEYIIFIRPKSKFTEPGFEKFKDLEKARELYLLRSIIRSEIFDQFESKTISDIHLVFKDQNYQISKAYHFSSSSFKGIEKPLLLSSIYESIESANPNIFWEIGKNYVQRYDFN